MWSRLPRLPLQLLACTGLAAVGLSASAQGPAAPAGARAGQAPAQAYPLYQEPWRPQFHFSQPAQFMNDPNGLIYANGQWNMYYQLRPGGAIVWGHAVSKDMLHWENMGVAIPAQADGKSIFSGSAVIDYNNTSGLGSKQNPAMVAIYTASGAGSQAQGLAYSLDHGRTFKFYSGNPVLDIGQSQFRDPSVFWYEPSKSWIMAVANPNDHQVSIHGSPDLKKWTLLSKWGPLPPTGGVYECPALFPLQVDGKASRTKWVMVISTNPGGLWGGSMTAAYIGDFDGKSFKEDSRYRYDGPAGTTSLETFDGASYGQWTASGAAFGTSPQHPSAAAAGSAASRLTGFQGAGLATSLGAEGVGSLTSPAFTISKRYINFELGGANAAAGGGRGAAPTPLPGRVGIDLMVDGTVVRSANAAGGNALDWIAWDVGEFSGKTGSLRLVDENASPTAGIALDQVGLSDTPALAGNDRAPWLDWGKDNYAGIPYNNAPGGRRLFVGWLSNWQYAQTNAVPTTQWWRGLQSEPRDLALRTIDGRPELFQTPAPELAKLRMPRPYSMPARLISGDQSVATSGDSLDIEVSLRGRTASSFGIKVLVGPNGDETVVGYDVKKGQIYIDRTKSGAAGAAMTGFYGVHSAPLKLRNGRLDLRILVDRSVVEVFANGGERALTDLVYPAQGSQGLSLFATGGAARLDSLRVHTMRSIWPSAPQAAR